MQSKSDIIQEIEKLPEPLLKEVWDFARFLQGKTVHAKSETTVLSESLLGKDWLKPEEDEAWQNL